MPAGAGRLTRRSSPPARGRNSSHPGARQLQAHVRRLTRLRVSVADAGDRICNDPGSRCELAVAMSQVLHHYCVVGAEVALEGQSELFVEKHDVLIEDSKLILHLKKPLLEINGENVQVRELRIKE